MKTSFVIKALLITCLLSGCAGSLKKEVAADLGLLVQGQNCENHCQDICLALKLYISSKLGGSPLPIPEPPPEK